MVGDERHRLSEFVDLLLGTAGNVLNAPAPRLWLGLRLINDDDAQQKRLDPSRCHGSPLYTAYGYYAI